MPARRKFLKKDSVELGHILREFERLALVNPGIDFTLISNDVTLHQLRHATEKQRIIDLFGKSGAMDFDVEDAPDIPAFDPRAGIIAPDTAVDSNYNPFADTPSTARPSRINSDNAPATHNRTPRAATNWEATTTTPNKKRSRYPA